MNKIIKFSFLCSIISLFYASEHQLVTPKKIGIFSEINKRKYQEDFFYHGIVDGGNLYAVYDGHYCHRIGYTENDDSDGSLVAQFLAEKFPVYFNQTSGSIRERMITTCKSIDNDEFIKKHKECGSTAAIVFIKDKIAHCLHIGNSRIVLEKNGLINFFTKDHVPNKIDESLRIIKSGGVIFEKRVNGFLSITRAFGDYILDKGLIIAEPDYEEISLNGQQFLVLATNGLWDKVGNEEAVAILKLKKDSINDMNLLAKMLGMFAVARNSYDNITVMLVDLLS